VTRGWQNRNPRAGLRDSIKARVKASAARPG